jgi:hypothetical protein
MIRQAMLDQERKIRLSMNGHAFVMIVTRSWLTMTEHQIMETIIDGLYYELY